MLESAHGDHDRLPPRVTLAIATTEDELARVVARLDELGLGPTRVVAPSADRRVVLVDVSDEWEAHRLVALLRAEGELAVTRPDSGARLQGWMRHTRPASFERSLSVCFAWSEHDRGEFSTAIELGPGGFGSGDHLSTRLVVEELVRRIRGGERVLDVGCGSGVLGLCALGLGAAGLVAVDVKPEAIDATRRNAALNGMGDRVEATLGSLGEIGETFDVVLANIGRGAIVELAAQLVRCTKPDAWLAVSGIAPSQCSQVAGFLRPLVELDRRESGEWSMVVLGRGD